MAHHFAFFPPSSFLLFGRAVPFDGSEWRTFFRPLYSLSSSSLGQPVGRIRGSPSGEEGNRRFAFFSF